MKLTDEERRIIVSLEIEKSDNIFQQNSELKRLGYWDNVANRLYYAVFHSVSALLIKDGHEVASHKGATALFGRYYIVTGKMPQQYGKLYSQLQTLREKSDYNCSFTAKQEDIDPLIGQTADMLVEIKSLVGQ